MELNKPDNAKYKTKLGIIEGIPIRKVPTATNRIGAYFLTRDEYNTIKKRGYTFLLKLRPR
jgi:hypothetical protein